jgi:PAS domain S-box-containing protein
VANAEEFYRLLLDAIDQPALIGVDGTEHILAWNRSAEQLVGWKAEQVLGLPLSRLFTPNHPEEVQGREDSSGRSTIAGRWSRPDGSSFLSSLVRAPLRSEDASMVGYAITVVEGVPKGRDGQPILDTSEERFRLLVDGVRDYAIFMLDPQGVIASWNAGAERIKGYSAKEAIGSHFSRFYTPEDIARRHPWKELEAATELGRYEEEGARVRKDGSRFWANVVITALRDSTGVLRGFAKVTRDTTERRLAQRKIEEMQAELERRVEERTAALQRETAERMRTEEALRTSEEQLRQSQKLEALGRLAGAVAHDFNNMLSIILSYSHFLLQEPDFDARRMELEEILRAGERASELTKQLLAFSRKQILDVRVLDVNEIVSSVDRILSRLLREDIERHVLLETETVHICGDRSQIEQVILNLVVNARDAMPHGGKLTLETAAVELSPTYAVEHIGVEPGPYVLIAVSDTGVGMDRETQEQAFEPFFTTKEPGKGTGLGLSTAFGIVKQMGGSIWLYSELGNGSTFKVYLPRVEGAVEASSEPAIQPANRPHGMETILLVEDEEQVRRMVHRTLRRQGYHVLEAASPGDALLLCEQHPVRIHLLLTDVVMPRMNGREVAERARRLRPDLKVLFMSGYTDNVVTHHGLLDSDVHMIAKPITPDALLQKIRDVLDETRHPNGNSTPSPRG